MSPGVCSAPFVSSVIVLSMPAPTLKHLMISAVFALGCLMFVGKGAAAEQIRYFHLLSGDAAGSGFVMAESIASVISGPPGAPPCSLDSRCGVPGLIGVAQSSPGPIASLSILAEGLADAALVRASLIHYADKQNIISRAMMPSLRHVSNVGTHQLHLIASPRLIVAGVAELAPYRIGIGSPRSEVPAVAMALFEAAGLPTKQMQLMALPDVEAANLLAVGKLDAMIFVGQAETRFIADLLATGAGIDLPIDEAVLDKLAGNISGTYKINLPDPVQDNVWRQVLAFPVSLIVHQNTGAPLVGSVLESIWWQGNQGILEAGGLGPLSTAHAFELMQLPLHEGAGGYFAENGGLPRGVVAQP